MTIAIFVEATAVPRPSGALGEIDQQTRPRALRQPADAVAGLRAVLTLVKKRIKAANGVFALCAVQGPVREVLDITGFTTMIDVQPELASALAAMA